MVAPEGRKRASSCSLVAAATVLTLRLVWVRSQHQPARALSQCQPQHRITALSPTDSRRAALHDLSGPCPSTQGAKPTGSRGLLPHTPSPSQQHRRPLLPAELQLSAKGPQCTHLGLCKVLLSGHSPLSCHWSPPGASSAEPLQILPSVPYLLPSTGSKREGFVCLAY